MRTPTYAGDASAPAVGTLVVTAITGLSQAGAHIAQLQRVTRADAV